jgi:hypothetical protein
VREHAATSSVILQLSPIVMTHLAHRLLAPFAAWKPARTQRALKQKPAAATAPNPLREGSSRSAEA